MVFIQCAHHTISRSIILVEGTEWLLTVIGVYGFVEFRITDFGLQVSVSSFRIDIQVILLVSDYYCLLFGLRVWIMDFL